MNLVEKLLAIDKGIITKEEKKEIVSKEMTRLLGSDKPVKITIKAIDGDTFTSLTAAGTDDSGNFEIDKAYDISAKIVAAGLVNPDLKNKDLQAHVGASDPADAAKKIFKGELTRIGTIISELSGFGDIDDEVEEVKN